VANSKENNANRTVYTGIRAIHPRSEQKNLGRSALLCILFWWNFPGFEGFESLVAVMAEATMPDFPTAGRTPFGFRLAVGASVPRQTVLYVMKRGPLHVFCTSSADGSGERTYPPHSRDLLRGRCQ
jgi:hypothetical protein